MESQRPAVMKLLHRLDLFGQQHQVVRPQLAHQRRNPGLGHRRDVNLDESDGGEQGRHSLRHPDDVIEGKRIAEAPQVLATLDNTRGDLHILEDFEDHTVGRQRLDGVTQQQAFG